MERILIIEDTGFIRDEIRAILEYEGYKMFQAPDGRDGVRLALEHRPDLILCDVMMPELDGYGVLAELRSNPATALIPFVFLTALKERDEVRKGMNLGADDYLLKPIRRRELIEAVQTRLTRTQVSARKLAEALEVQLKGSSPEDASNHDPLTGLPNQRFLDQWLAHELSHASEGRHLGVMVLEVDRFAAVHHALGARAADELIRTLAERLQSSGLPQEAKVFRTRESEFVVLIPRLPDPHAAASAALFLLQLVKRPLPVAKHTLHLTASIGISLGPLDGTDPHELLGQAHLALNRAEEQGRGVVQLYRPGFKDRANSRLTLETHLRQALQRKALETHYQPQVDLVSGNIFGFEALARWEDPLLGRISPGEFIPLAESCGLIQAVGAWGLRSACSQLKLLQEAGFENVSVAVNVSAEQLRDRQIVEDVRTVLSESGVSPQSLVLELTEGVLLSDVDLRIDLLGDLRALGVRTALDDFGTGYSSLAYLKHLPLDQIKIDQSFVNDLTLRPEAAAITAAIITLGHGLGLQVLAEGVETLEQAVVLRSQGCDAAQGYFYGRPQPPAELSALLRRNRSSDGKGPFRTSAG